MGQVVNLQADCQSALPSTFMKRPLKPPGRRPRSRAEKINPVPTSRPTKSLTIHPLPANPFPHKPALSSNPSQPAECPALYRSQHSGGQGRRAPQRPHLRPAHPWPHPPLGRPEEYKQLWAALVAEWQPQTQTERMRLEQMAISQWCSPAWPRKREESASADCHSTKSCPCWTGFPRCACAWSVPSPPRRTN